MTGLALRRYSDLLLDYSLQIRADDHVFIQSTTLAEPLLEMLYAGIMMRGGVPEINMSVKSQESNFNRYAHPSSIAWLNPTYVRAMETFDAYLYVRAPFLETEFHAMDPVLLAQRRNILAPTQKLYYNRTGDKSLRRSLCQFPTEAAAFDAGMSLVDYEVFVMESCFLHTPDPAARWTELSRFQAGIVEYLNRSHQIRYLNAKTDITCSVKGRNWINSDGRANMPSGEVFTSPIEDSVHGHIYFDYPLFYQQRLIQGIALEVTNGVVTHASAEIGQEVLLEILAIPGANRFGEVAIGTNPYIQTPTKNILFDEKMSGTVHMALGQSYLQCGGLNESSLHLDLIADMRDGHIEADGKIIYQNGRFVV